MPSGTEGTAGTVSSTGASTSGAAVPLSWPSESRTRFDLPPSKLHCQSPEQRACASHHTNPLTILDSMHTTSSSDSGAAYPAPKGWCPFASDVYAVGVILYEMSTGNRWNGPVMEVVVENYLKEVQAGKMQQPQPQSMQQGNKPNAPVIADDDDEPMMSDEPRLGSPTQHAPAPVVFGSPSSGPLLPASALTTTTNSSLLALVAPGVDPVVWDLVCQCTAPEKTRIKSHEMRAHPFFAMQQDELLRA